jgi:hypothetical protein
MKYHVTVLKNWIFYSFFPSTLNTYSCCTLKNIYFSSGTRAKLPDNPSQIGAVTERGREGLIAFMKRPTFVISKVCIPFAFAKSAAVFATSPPDQRHACFSVYNYYKLSINPVNVLFLKTASSLDIPINGSSKTYPVLFSIP